MIKDYWTTTTTFSNYADGYFTYIYVELENIIKIKH